MSRVGETPVWWRPISHGYSTEVATVERSSRTRYAVLGMLTVEPMSGYDLRATIDRTVGHFWHEGYGRLYPTLKELTAEGLVEGRTEPGRGPRRTVHRLTDTGWAELRRWLGTPPIAWRTVLGVRRDASPDAPAWLLTVRHGVHLARASLAWCDEALDVLTAFETQEVAG